MPWLTQVCRSRAIATFPAPHSADCRHACATTPETLGTCGTARRATAPRVKSLCGIGDDGAGFMRADKDCATPRRRSAGNALWSLPQRPRRGALAPLLLAILLGCCLASHTASGATPARTGTFGDDNYPPRGALNRMPATPRSLAPARGPKAAPVIRSAAWSWRSNRGMVQGRFQWQERNGRIDYASVCRNERPGSLRYRDCRGAAPARPLPGYAGSGAIRQPAMRRTTIRRCAEPVAGGSPAAGRRRSARRPASGRTPAPRRATARPAARRTPASGS